MSVVHLLCHSLNSAKLLRTKAACGLQARFCKSADTIIRDYSMKRLLFSGILLYCSLAYAAERQASCTIAPNSIIGRSPAGIPLLSNIALIEITCSAPGRPWPSDHPWPSDTKTEFQRSMLRLKTVAYQIGEGNTRTLVHSIATVTGGKPCGPPAISGECSEESLLWFLNIPLEPAEAIGQLRALAKKLASELSSSPEQRHQMEESIQKLERNPDELAEVVRQYRIGHFVVECRIMDGDQLWSVGHVEFETLFKGNVFDQLLSTPKLEK